MGVEKELERGKRFYSQAVMESSGGAAFLTTTTGKPMIMMSPEILRKTAIERAVKGGLSREAATKAVQSEEFLSTNLYHEVLEKQSKERFLSLTKMPTQHEASQVLIGEGGFIQQVGNKDIEQLYSAIRKGRKEEFAAFSAGLEGFKEGAKTNRALKEVLSDFTSVQTVSNRAKEALVESSHRLRADQERVWKAGVSGGSGHNSRKPPSVI